MARAGDRDPTAHEHALADVTDAGTAAAADVGDFATAAASWALLTIARALTAATKETP